MATVSESGVPGRTSVLSAGLIYTLANISSAAVPFLLLPLLTRVLDTAEYGRIINFFMLVTLCGATAGLSLHGAIGVRWFDRTRMDFGAYTSACMLLICVSTLATAFVVTLVLEFARVDLGLSPGWVAAAALVSGTNTMLNSRLVLWQSQHRAVPAAALQVGNSVLVMALSVIGVVWLHMGAAGRMGGALLGGSIVAAIGAYSMMVREQLRGSIVREHVVGALRFGGLLIPHVFAGVVMATSDRFIVGSMLGPAAVGTYGVVAQLGTVMTILGDAFSKTYSPWLYARLSRNEQRDRQAVVGTTWLAIPAFFLAAFCAGLALQLLGPAVVGEKFHKDLPLVWWFVCGGAFNGVYLALAGFFFFRSRTELVSVVTGTSAILGVVLAFCLVKTFGVAGGGMAYCATQAIAAVIAMSMVVRQWPELPWGSVRAATIIAFRELR